MKTLLFTALVFCIAHAAAQPFPSRPVRLVVANPPGGVPDILARTIGQRIAEVVRDIALVEDVVLEEDRASRRRDGRGPRLEVRATIDQ